MVIAGVAVNRIGRHRCRNGRVVKRNLDGVDEVVVGAPCVGDVFGPEQVVRLNGIVLVDGTAGIGGECAGAGGRSPGVRDVKGHGAVALHLEAKRHPVAGTDRGVAQNGDGGCLNHFDVHAVHDLRGAAGVEHLQCVVPAFTSVGEIDVVLAVGAAEAVRSVPLVGHIEGKWEGGQMDAVTLAMSVAGEVAELPCQRTLADRCGREVDVEAVVAGVLHHHGELLPRHHRYKRETSHIAGPDDVPR